MAKERVLHERMHGDTGNGMRVVLLDSGVLRFDRLYTPDQNKPPCATWDYLLSMDDFHAIVKALAGVAAS